MARRPSTSWDTTPHKAIRYGVVARYVDRRAGRGDAKVPIPVLPPEPIMAADPETAITPYLAIRRHHFLDRAERERRHMLTDLQPVYQQQAVLSAQITAAREKLAEIQQRLAGIAETPDDAALRVRTTAEQYADEWLVRTRRLREHHTARAKVLAELRQAAEAVRALVAEEARLGRVITERERILEARVRQLHQHTLRRCGTYRHYLVREHPAGADLIPFLDLALPALPDWLPKPPGPGDGPEPPGPDEEPSIIPPGIRPAAATGNGRLNHRKETP